MNKEQYEKLNEYLLMNYGIELKPEEQRAISYQTLYEAYMNTSDKLRESDYKLYQIEQYINDEITRTPQGVQFLKYTKEGSKILGIIRGETEYKQKKK
jgi:hypothetical protein